MSIGFTMKEIRENYLNKVKRVIIKIGSKALSNGKDKISRRIIQNLTISIHELRKRDIEVILITSGAILAGNEYLNINVKNTNIIKKQVLSSLGQIKLMTIYSEFFQEKNILVSQLLLTNDIFQDRKRFLNARATILELLKMNIIPIVNENDTVSIDEIMFGDNDILASKVASMVDAEFLILLTDIDGLYNGNPKKNKNAKLINLISEKEFDSKILSDTDDKISAGGMTSKIYAALNVSKFGIPTIIANGMKKNIINNIFSYKDIGTMIVPSDKFVKNRKKWIGIGLKTSGKIFIDDGAVSAIIHKGKSLLPSGIKKVQGTFEKGQQVVIINDSNSENIAKGLISYSSNELNKIIGKKSSQIESILGYKYSDEIIHRDNLIIEKTI
ncbi:glutamate 5-kinase [bacterium]|nr:glutamate 5-kinase [bacterium]